MRRTRVSGGFCVRELSRIAATEKGGQIMRLKLLAVGASAAAGIWMLAPGVSSAGVSQGHGIPRYNHIVEIIMENTSFSTIIGNPLAPNINALASKFGLATDYSA